MKGSSCSQIYALIRDLMKLKFNRRANYSFSKIFRRYLLGKDKKERGY